MQLLIEKELKSTDKILKPDFNSKSGRELLAFYLQTKFRQIYLYDKKQEVSKFGGRKKCIAARFFLFIPTVCTNFAPQTRHVRLNAALATCLCSACLWAD